jgi:AcrR family transcriptional regulator
MARTQAPDYEDRRRAIVEKAAELYAERGFLGASVAELAEACGASKSLIYHYFPSKEDILFEVMQSHIASLVEAAEATGRLDLAPEAKLRALTAEFMRLYIGAGARQKVLLNDLGRLPEAARVIIVGEQRQLIAFVEGLLRELGPAIAPRRLRPAAMLYFGMINWTHTWYRPAGEVAPAELADMVVDLVLRGLRGEAA